MDNDLEQFYHLLYKMLGVMYPTEFISLMFCFLILFLFYILQYIIRKNSDLPITNEIIPYIFYFRGKNGVVLLNIYDIEKFKKLYTDTKSEFRVALTSEFLAHLKKGTVYNYQNNSLGVLKHG